MDSTLWIMSQNVFFFIFANWYQPTSLLIVLEEDIYYHSSDEVYHSLKATNNYTTSRRRVSILVEGYHTMFRNSSSPLCSGPKFSKIYFHIHIGCRLVSSEFCVWCLIFNQWISNTFWTWERLLRLSNFPTLAQQAFSKNIYASLK